jgi:hypothetical protein
MVVKKIASVENQTVHEISASINSMQSSDLTSEPSKFIQELTNLNAINFEALKSLKEKPQDPHKIWIKNFNHACKCTGTCSSEICDELKKVVFHTKYCIIRRHGTCSTCTQVASICKKHIETCVETDCEILICTSIKQKILLRESEKLKLS